MGTNKQLTRKQQAFVNYWQDHPKASGTEAALASYDTSDPVVAASIAYEKRSVRIPRSGQTLGIRQQSAYLT